MRFGSAETRCRSCRDIYQASDLDRYLWCPGCREAVKRRGARWARVVGAVAALGVAAYLHLRVHPSARYLAFYLLILGLTYILTSRIAAAVVKGYFRSRGGVPLPRGQGGAGPNGP